jgi:hypothetical protein
MLATRELQRWLRTDRLFPRPLPLALLVLLLRINYQNLIPRKRNQAPATRLIVGATCRHERTCAMSVKQIGSVAAAGLLTLAMGISVASAAETGTKTMPDSSINPPTYHRVHYNQVRHGHCYLPSEPCGNNHRVTN